MTSSDLRRQIGRRLMIWGVLMALLALTVGLTFAPLGPFRLVASLAIAASKAGLVVWVYMELAKANGIIRLTIGCAGVFLAILILLPCLDFALRR